MTITANSGKILITGATGNVGLEVVQQLQEFDVPMIVGVRNIEKARKTLGEQLNYVKFDFEDLSTYEPAMQGVKKIFLVRPPQIADVPKYFHPIIDTAKKAGVQHIVFLSLLGVEKNKVVPHHKIEKYIMESGIDYTFLRASFFMQNLNTTHLEDIRDHNEIFLPAGRGRTSFIDVRDIATVGVKALVEAGHRNQAYPLTGKEALNYFEVAEVFSKVLGRKITYPNPSIWTFFHHMRAKGIKTGFVLVMIALYTTARLGLAKKTTDDLERLLGREPITVEKFVRDYQECWK